MNALRPPFSLAVLPALGRPLAIVGACAIVSACASVPFTDTKVDPNSPVAADVTRVTRQADKSKFPTFAGIPAKPKDVRPLGQYGRDARSVAAAGEALIAATEPSTWTLQNTTAFAERGRRDAGADIPPVQPGESEAFARALRERATPPPPR
jgi:hypothetical protein